MDKEKLLNYSALLVVVVLLLLFLFVCLFVYTAVCRKQVLTGSSLIPGSF